MKKEHPKKDEPVLPVDLDPESELPPDADIEERFNEFWKRNGLWIFLVVVLVGGIVIGRQTFEYIGERRETAIQDAFLALDSSAARIAFAEEHARHTLAGMTWMHLAAEKYEAEDFTQAAGYYERAGSVLQGSPMADRARLGRAMSLLMLGDAASADEYLEALSLDARVLDSTRAEAAYHQAVMRWEKGDVAAAGESLERIFALDDAAIWEQRATFLQDRIPGLAGSPTGNAVDFR
ncbi:MAG: tetratricopeptide repeat protein [Opitutales bacterium]|nr:tetratricopeptide repeat protein [Opitutales bacterium]